MKYYKSTIEMGDSKNTSVYTGIIEQDENNNFFCGEYLLDYKTVMTNHKLGDKITIKSLMDNPSDISSKIYPKKSKHFDKANNRFIK